jgi:hypothetical protein
MHRQIATRTVRGERPLPSWNDLPIQSSAWGPASLGGDCLGSSRLACQTSSEFDDAPPGAFWDVVTP